jgi:hypothetical protein
MISFCFLKTHNRACAFFQFITHDIPFARGIKASDIPTQNIPNTIIHKENNVE